MSSLMAKPKNKLEVVTTRLFARDVAELREIAETKGLAWQIELRLLVRRALAGDRREVLIVKDHQ